MNITTTTGLVGFLLALSAFNLPQVQASTASTVASATDSVESTIEQRLNRISLIIKEQEDNLPESTTTDLGTELAQAWGNGRGRGWADGRGSRGWSDGRGSRGWVNGRNGGGWGNGRGGTWVNGGRWSDGGGFWNRR